MINRGFRYLSKYPGYPIVRVRFGVDTDIYADDTGNDYKIGNNNSFCSSFIWLAVVLPFTLFIAWCIVETILAFSQWRAAEKLRKKTREQIEKFPKEIEELNPQFKVLDKNRFISASCYFQVRPYFLRL